MSQPMWQVQEDQGGRWRDFPEALRQQVERQYMEWAKSGRLGELVVEFIWPNAKQTSFTPYEIHCRIVDGSMEYYQINVLTQHRRAVRRFWIMDEIM